MTKDWSFSFSTSPSSEYSGLISFWIDWFDLAAQGTLKRLLQHHSWKASILRHSVFFIVQLSHPNRLPFGSDSKESACNVGNPGSIPGSGRYPTEGNGYPLQYSFLENSMDRGAWQTTVHGVAKSQTRLNNTFISTPIHDYWTNHSFDYMDLRR